MKSAELVEEMERCIGDIQDALFELGELEPKRIKGMWGQQIGPLHAGPNWPSFVHGTVSGLGHVIAACRKALTDEE